MVALEQNHDLQKTHENVLKNGHQNFRRKLTIFLYRQRRGLPSASIHSITHSPPPLIIHSSVALSLCVLLLASRTLFLQRHLPAESLRRPFGLLIGGSRRPLPARWRTATELPLLRTAAGKEASVANGQPPQRKALAPPLQ